MFYTFLGFLILAAVGLAGIYFTSRNLQKRNRNVLLAVGVVTLVPLALLRFSPSGGGCLIGPGLAPLGVGIPTLVVSGAFVYLSRRSLQKRNRNFLLGVAAVTLIPLAILVFSMFTPPPPEMIGVGCSIDPWANDVSLVVMSSLVVITTLMSVGWLVGRQSVSD